MAIPLEADPLAGGRVPVDVAGELIARDNHKVVVEHTVRTFDIARDISMVEQLLNGLCFPGVDVGIIEHSHKLPVLVLGMVKKPERSSS